MKRVDSLCIPIIRDLGIQDGVRLAEIKKNWFTLFNKPLCYHMSPSLFSKGEILLNVDSPVWLQELQYYKEDIIKKMAPYGVKAVRFRIGRVLAKASSKKRLDNARVKQLTSYELSYIENTVSQIYDDELKESVHKAMTKSLRAQRTKK